MYTELSMDNSTEGGGKRKADSEHYDGRDKRAKTKKQWRVPRKNDHGALPPRVIQPGDSGIWATCNKGRERKCVGELRDLFTEYAELLYGDAVQPLEGDENKDGDANAEVSIEDSIKTEVAGIREPTTAQLFTPVRTDVQCVIFFKTSPPVEPVSFIKRICEDALANPRRKRTRFAKRLSPVTLIGRATEEGLEAVCKQVLAPHFHTEPVQPRSFAIRPNLRNHNVLSRDSIIKQIARLVGPGHSVDLKNYELLILVEVYQNVVGVSVVDSRFEALKRFNLAEIFDPTPREEIHDAVRKVENGQGLGTEETFVSTSDVDALPTSLQKEGSSMDTT